MLTLKNFPTLRNFEEKSKKSKINALGKKIIRIFKAENRKVFRGTSRKYMLQFQFLDHNI